MTHAASRLAKVSVAILSWNGRHHLEPCLAALAALEDPGVPWEVVVLDNGSTDGTAPWMRERHPEVRLIESPVNLGFCAGCNRLVEAAEGDAVAFLNNDARPHPAWLGSLVETLGSAPPDVAAVSGCLLDWEGRRLDFARGVMTFDGHAFQDGFGRPLARAEIPASGTELLFACGGNLLVRKEAFRALGGFDEDYFAYLEDVDLGWRSWAAGWRVIFSAEAIAYHRSSATSDLLGHWNRGFLFERNAFLTAYKNYEPALWERWMPVVLLTLLSRTQTLMVQNNPGGALLTLDPYAGHIANTAAPESAPGVPESRWERWRDRWRRYGGRQVLVRGLARALQRLGGSDPLLAEAPWLTDGRTLAQLQAQTFLLSHLDRAAEKRARVGELRRRSDEEIFERFPLYLVPTYPGDEGLFSGPGFSRWLPEAPVLRRAELSELMEL